MEDVVAQGVLDPHGMQSSEQQRFQRQGTAGSVAGTESVNHQEQPAAIEGSRISSGASVTTGPVEPSYAPSGAGTAPVDVA